MSKDDEINKKLDAFLLNDCCASDSKDIILKSCDNMFKSMVTSHYSVCDKCGRSFQSKPSYTYHRTSCKGKSLPVSDCKTVQKSTTVGQRKAPIKPVNFLI